MKHSLLGYAAAFLLSPCSCTETAMPISGSGVVVAPRSVEETSGSYHYDPDEMTLAISNDYGCILDATGRRGASVGGAIHCWGFDMQGRLDPPVSDMGVKTGRHGAAATATLALTL